MAKQAYIAGINDDFLIAALITLLGIVPIFWMHTKKKKHEKVVPHE
jgi:DHA2 family multidrug resistance protein